MQKQLIFVIEDHEDIAQLISFNLQNHGFEVTTFENGEFALAALKNKRPQLIILDLMLPGRSGLEICEILKGQGDTQNIPLIIVSAKGTEADIVRGLELGADDYVTKPFSPEVLVARTKALLRRASRLKEPSSSSNSLLYGGVSIDPVRREVRVDGNKLDLTYSEFEILYFLCRKPGWVFTRGQIVNAIRGQNYAVTERSIDVALVGLRKKLGARADNIETIRGVGYRYKEFV